MTTARRTVPNASIGARTARTPHHQTRGYKTAREKKIRTRPAPLVN